MLTPISLQHFRGRHAGKMGFLLGCGPSLAQVDESLLAPYVTMAVAESVFKLPNPDYFFSCDGFMWIHGLVPAARKSTCTTIIAGNTPSVYGDSGGMEFGVGRKWASPTAQRNIPGLDDTELIVGAVSSQPALHLLYVMGCDPIVLLGMDGGPIDGVHSFWMMPEYYSACSPELRAFYGENPQEEHAKRHTDAECVLGGSASLSVWDEIHRHAKATILNASMRSRIECFEKMELKGVLSKHGERKKA